MKGFIIEESDNIPCDAPCDPDNNCPECADYWKRMISEGFWDKQKHQWTEKGWREITK